MIARIGSRDTAAAQQNYFMYTTGMDRAGRLRILYEMGGHVGNVYSATSEEWVTGLDFCSLSSWPPTRWRNGPTLFWYI